MDIIKLRGHLLAAYEIAERGSHTWHLIGHALTAADEYLLPEPVQDIIMATNLDEAEFLMFNHGWSARWAGHSACGVGFDGIAQTRREARQAIGDTSALRPLVHRWEIIEVLDGDGEVLWRKSQRFGGNI